MTAPFLAGLLVGLVWCALGMACTSIVAALLEGGDRPKLFALSVAVAVGMFGSTLLAVVVLCGWFAFKRF